MADGVTLVEVLLLLVLRSGEASAFASGETLRTDVWP